MTDLDRIGCVDVRPFPSLADHEYRGGIFQLLAALFENAEDFGDGIVVLEMLFDAVAAPVLDRTQICLRIAHIGIDARNPAAVAVAADHPFRRVGRAAVRIPPAHIHALPVEGRGKRAVEVIDILADAEADLC